MYPENVINDIERLDLLRNIRKELKARELYLIDKAAGIAGKGKEANFGVTRRSSDHIGNYIDDLEAVQEEIRELDLEMERRELHVLEAIANLPNDEGSVMYYRYIKRMSWKQVAGSIHYSENYCMRLRKNAIKRLKNSYFNNLNSNFEK